MTQTEAEIARLMEIFNPLQVTKKLYPFSYDVVYNTKEYRGSDVVRDHIRFGLTVWAETWLEADNRVDKILAAQAIPFSCAKRIEEVEGAN